MTKTNLAVIWFKRDLRVFDHYPLVESSRFNQTLPIYVYEPEIINSPDYSTQHLNFTNECLTELRSALEGRGSSLLIQHGEITFILSKLLSEFGKFTLLSHEETGNLVSYKRDLKVKNWCELNNILWKEFQSVGIFRNLASRDQWSKILLNQLNLPLHSAPDFIKTPQKKIFPSGMMTSSQLGLKESEKPFRQKGGRKKGEYFLNHFFKFHLDDYYYSMSSPITAEESCSRISPYITFGVFSVREVYQKIKKIKNEINPSFKDSNNFRPHISLRSFEKRLFWRCHFIQRLESESTLESKNIHSGFDSLREPFFNDDFFEKWINSETGFPLIDASMKMLSQVGWINFRMRALLISFSSNQLWNHWQKPAIHLAKEFLDYEPGVHYSQIQMQSGVTGMNTLRIYNPIKQAQDQDPEGKFVKKWIPELKNIPKNFIFQPEKIPLEEQKRLGCIIGKNYPNPIINHIETAKAAKEKLWLLKNNPEIREETKKVYLKHGSRSSKKNSFTKRKIISKKKLHNPNQLKLEFD